MGDGSIDTAAEDGGRYTAEQLADQAEKLAREIEERFTDRLAEG